MQRTKQIYFWLNPCLLNIRQKKFRIIFRPFFRQILFLKFPRLRTDKMTDIWTIILPIIGLQFFLDLYFHLVFEMSIDTHLMATWDSRYEFLLLLFLGLDRFCLLEISRSMLSPALAPDIAWMMFMPSPLLGCPIHLSRHCETV